jgi:hypothetical protein
MRWWASSRSPKRVNVVKKREKCLFGKFWGKFLIQLWALAHFPIILDIFI